MRRGLLPLVAGLAMVATFGVVACRTLPPPPAGEPPPSVAPSVEPAPTPDKKDSAPVGLRIPAMELEAVVDPVGVDDNGDFAVPPSVDRVGWYRYGPGVATAVGSIVVAGHVDSATQGEGAFYRLGRLAPGDRVTLLAADGGTREFRVVSRERYRKTAVPLDRYFARDGDVRLTLITCGGPFDRSSGHYRDNVVVTAVPL